MPENTTKFFAGESIEAFRILAEESPDIVFIYSNERIVYVNKRFENILGYSKDEIFSTEFSYLKIISSESMEAVQTIAARLRDRAETPTYEYTLISKNGNKVYALITAKHVKFNDSDAVLCIVTDISNQKIIEKALREAEEKHRIILDSLSDAITVVDKNLTILSFNQAGVQRAATLGSGPNLIGRNLLEVFPFLPASAADEYRSVIEKGEILLTEETVKMKGKTIFTETKKIPVFENEMVTKVVTVTKDITQAKKYERQLKRLNAKLAESNKKLKYLSITDSHTGIYNHRFLEGALEKEFFRAKREERPLSLIMIDLDYFKSINDVYGHPFGDLVLKQFADLIKGMVRKYNIVIRYGGEEFVIISPETNRGSAVTLAQRILEEINLRYFGQKNNMIKIKASLAVAAFPEDNVVVPDDLFKKADYILNKAKEFGGNRVFSSLDIKMQIKKEKTKEETHSLKYMKEKMERLAKRSNQSLVESIFAFAKTIEAKDHYTSEHVERTANYAVETAKALGMNKEDVHIIRQASILHDIGKIGISEKILLKKSKLTTKEFNKIKEHPVIGADIIRPIHMLNNVIPSIMHHHERWSGKGYPAGLRGKEIPVHARIIAIADVFQALISNRPYRKAFEFEQAIKIIKAGAGKQFDPVIAEVFVKVLRREADPAVKREVVAAK